MKVEPRLPAEGGLRRSFAAIFTVSFVVLFFELVVIRWLAAEIEVFAYFKNFPLMAAFLGLGLGSLAASSQDRLSRRFVWLFAAIALLLAGSEHLQLNSILLPDSSIETWSDSTISARYESVLVPILQMLALPSWLVSGAIQVVFLAVVLAVMVLVAVLFVPLGQALGRSMNTTRPLAAYSVNVAGSLAGIGAFTLLAFLQTPPIVWVLVGVAVALTLLPRDWRTALPVGLALGGVLVYSLLPDVLWSPYYRVSYSPLPGHAPPVGYSVAVNHRYHQLAIDLSDESLSRRPDLSELRAQYDLPFEAAARLDRVAVAGAGTGNDVAAALRQGSKQIVAVEIDPSIIGLGHRLHGERPYAFGNVQIVNTDARAWLRQGGDQFDVISFGLLDSHTLLSTMSSIRLESYLYTVEGIREALGRLGPDGVAAVSFAIVSRDWLAERLFNTIERATGEPPLVVATPHLHVLTYLFGPGVQPSKVSGLAAKYGFEVVSDRYGRQGVRAATDDWPFLYLNPTQAPVVYLIALMGLLALSYVAVRSRLKEGGSLTALNVQMFFMGAAFLLVETKSITELSLLFGSTWVVNSAVFAAILLMILLANAVVSRWAQPNLPVVYTLLVLALVAAFVAPVSSLNSLGLVERAVIGSTLSALPIAFSGVVFATAFRMVPKASVALGWNLFGAVVGGVLEASSMWLGIKSLSLLAAGLYALSWLALAAAKQQTELTEPVLPSAPNPLSATKGNSP